VAKKSKLKVVQAPKESKAPWESKTMWVAAITALAPLYPPLGAVVAANPGVVLAAVSAVFAGLRWVSEHKIEF
jgi:hypothetical protein